MENITDLERVQKNALKIIMQDKYQDYGSALEKLNLESLYDRRERLCLKFACKTVKNDQVKHLFPLNQSDPYTMTRNIEKYRVTMANTDRHS